MKKTVLIAVAVLLVAVAAEAKTTSIKSRAWNDSTRLAALLTDAQSNVNVSSDVWRSVVNEANVLANRLVGEASGNKAARTAATSARMHVREMRKAALAGDAAGARQHASEALPFVTQVADWAAPKP